MQDDVLLIEQDPAKSAVASWFRWLPIVPFPMPLALPILYSPDPAEVQVVPTTSHDYWNPPAQMSYKEWLMKAQLAQERG